MSGQLVAFYAFAAVTVGGALGVVAARNVIHSALMLLMAMLGVAGLFLVAFAEFLALAQVLIYGGAVTIIVLFAIILTRVHELRTALDNPQRPWAALAATGVFVLLAVAFLNSNVPVQKGAATVAGAGADPASSGFEALGESLFTQWAIPFEIASVVLLVALIGAVVLARDDEERT